jgi:two-component system sensor histidine kinase KdpD
MTLSPAELWHASLTRLGPYLFAIAVVTVTVALAFLLPWLFPHASRALLFLTGVLVVSAKSGLGPSLLASFLSVLALNFFFTEPLHTLKVADDGDATTLAFFLLVSAISGKLASRMRQEMTEHRASLERISRLYAFSRQLASAVSLDEVVDALADQLALLPSVPPGAVRVLLAEGGRVPGHATIPREARRRGDDRELTPARVQAAWDGHLQEPFSDGDWLFIPLSTDRGACGLVALTSLRDPATVESARGLCDQAAVALDRTRLVADLEQVKLVSETEQLRSALLASVSHDLRTPLASIIGSATSLLEYGETFSAEDRRELLTMVAAEAKHLDRHIQNLLDMTRLSQGKLRLVRDWVDPHDLIAGALARLAEVLHGLEVEVRISPDVPLLWIHGTLIEQTLVNLLDNAAKFSPPGGRISIRAERVGEEVLIDLCDQGPGIPEEEREKIFDLFYSVSRGDRETRIGSGLGLAICRGMITAHGGQIKALAGEAGQGTCMRLSLPLASPELMPNPEPTP